MTVSGTGRIKGFGFLWGFLVCFFFLTSLPLGLLFFTAAAAADRAGAGGAKEEYGNMHTLNPTLMLEPCCGPASPSELAPSPAACPAARAAALPLP